MPKRSSKKREDINDTAARVVGRIIAISEEEESPPHVKNPAAVELGRRGGLKGGKVRAERLTAKERSEIASKAAAARWKKNGDR